MESEERMETDESNRILTLVTLPTDVLILILRKLDVQSFLQICKCSSIFYDLSLSHASSLWPYIDFKFVWPVTRNYSIFQRAAVFGNFFATLKLAVALLYNQGALFVSTFEENIRDSRCQAAYLFCQLEEMTTSAPFTWLFLRPPWALPQNNLLGCKETVFQIMAVQTKETPSVPLLLSVSKLLMLLEHKDYQSSQEEALGMLKKAARLGSNRAKLILWQLTNMLNSPDRGVVLEQVRQLRALTSQDLMEGQLTLCQIYLTSNFIDVTEKEASQFVSGIFRSSKPLNTQHIYERLQLQLSMRNILIDWLVEVVNLRQFRTELLYCAVSLIDRCMNATVIFRKELQLLGIAALVVASRYLGEHFISIDEAVWLSDGAYEYIHVVKMMAEIIGIVQGHIRTLNTFDLIQLLCLIEDSHLLTHYTGELSLQYAEVTEHSPAAIACSAHFLTRAALGRQPCWSPRLERYTGYSLKELTSCILLMHKKCYEDCSVIDRSGNPIRAISDRYDSEKFGHVSKLKMPCRQELLECLEIDQISERPGLTVTSSSFDFAIRSPSRKKQRLHCDTEGSLNRDSNTTEENSHLCQERRFQDEVAASVEGCAVPQESSSSSTGSSSIGGSHPLLTGLNGYDFNGMSKSDDQSLTP